MKLNCSLRVYLFALIATSSFFATAQVNQWTWIGGDNTGNNYGSYGTQGTGSVNNIPGGRSRSASFTDASGNFWLFGGNGYAANGFSGYLNDLWKFNRASRQWTWVKGDSTINKESVYGTKGIAADSCKPGGRWGCASWTDGSGNFWLFGGFRDSSNTQERISELWKFTVTTSRWAWMGGDTTGDNPGSYGTLNVSGVTNLPGARAYPTNWIDAQSNLWLLGGSGFANSGAAGDINDLWKYSTVTNQWTWVKGDSVTNMHGVYGTQGTGALANTPGAREFGMKWREGANLWLYAGYGYANTGSAGALNDVWKYNTITNQWTWIKGDSLLNQPAVYGTQNVFAAANTPRSRGLGMSWLDATGTFWMFGGTLTPNGNGTFNDLWKYNKTSNQWAWVNGDTISNQAGNYGTLEVPSIFNTPGARRQTVGWTGPNDSLWLFGGRGYANSGGTTAFLNDMWKNAYQALGTNPAISSFTPTTAPTNDTVFIVGVNFNNVTDVTFGGKPAKSFTILSSDTIRAIVGAGKSGFIAVFYATGSDSLSGFTLGTNRFLGTVDSLWTNSSNWEAGLVALDYANVQLTSTTGGGTTRQPVLDVDVIVNNMQMQKGMVLNGHSLSVMGNLSGLTNKVFTGSSTSKLNIYGSTGGTIYFATGAAILEQLNVGPGASITMPGGTEVLITGQ